MERKTERKKLEGEEKSTGAQDQIPGAIEKSMGRPVQAIAHVRAAVPVGPQFPPAQDHERVAHPGEGESERPRIVHVGQGADPDAAGAHGVTRR